MVEQPQEERMKKMIWTISICPKCGGLVHKEEEKMLGEACCFRNGQPLQEIEVVRASELERYAKVEELARDSRYSNEFVGNVFRSLLEEPADGR